MDSKTSIKSESDRLVKQSTFQKLISRPEVGAFSGMMAILIILGFVAGDVVYNPLGIKNNLSIISQLGIIAIGAFINDSR
jgi:simple sugar transport system permease protein